MEEGGGEKHVSFWRITTGQEKPRCDQSTKVNVGCYRTKKSLTSGDPFVREQNLHKIETALGKPRSDCDLNRWEQKGIRL